MDHFLEPGARRARLVFRGLSCGWVVPGGYGSLLAWDGLSGLWGACGLCPESRDYLPGKLLCHFTCGFDFVHSLLLPFEAALAVLKRLNGKKKN